MLKKTFVSTALIGSLVLAPLTGCESLPGNDEQQGAVIGGVSGAAAGALIGGDDNRLLGALIGGALGAGGGYLIGANKDKITGKDDDDRERTREEAIKASERAERNPAKVEDVDRARTADLNEDGFVTLDEVVAMRQANLSDREMVDRLERTDQVFELTDYQEDYLRTRGVSDNVIREMRSMNQDFARTASYDNDNRDSIDRDRDFEPSRDRDDDLDRNRL
jgi:hypothetical protein